MGLRLSVGPIDVAALHSSIRFFCFKQKLKAGMLSPLRHNSILDTPQKQPSVKTYLCEHLPISPLTRVCFLQFPFLDLPVGGINL